MSYEMQYLEKDNYSITILGSVLYCVNKKRRVRKSLDWGKTWRDLPYTFPMDLQSVFVTKEGILIACSSGLYYRSDDDGDTWTLVLESTASPYSFTNMWGWGQSPNGTIFAGEYGNHTKCLYIWRSKDLGLTWDRIDDLYGFADWHVHQVKVNKTTGRVYATIGDTPKKTFYSDDDGDTWVEMFSDKNTGFTGLTQTSNARFFTDDLYPGNNHIWKTTNDVDLIEVYKPTADYNTQSMFITAFGDNELWATAYNEYQFEGQKSAIFVSLDGGNTWSVEFESPVGGHQYINPIWGWDGSSPEYCSFFFCESKHNTQIIKVQRRFGRFATRPFLTIKKVKGPQLSQIFPVPTF